MFLHIKKTKCNCLILLNFIFLGVLFLGTFPLKASENISIYENSGQFNKSETSSIPLLDFIASAKKSLDIEIYEVREPLVQEALLEVLDRGVRVRIVAEPDPVGNSCDAFSKQNKSDNADCELSAQFTNSFYEKSRKRNNSSLIRYFNKKLCFDAENSKSASCYQHGKIVIADEESLLISTGNFNDSSLCVGEKRKTNSCNRDFSVIIHDKIKAKTLSSIFEMDLDSGATCDLPPKSPRPNGDVKKYTEALCTEEEQEVDVLTYQQSIKDILSNSKQNQNLTVSPVSQESLTDFISQAKKSIKIEAQYLKESDWLEALLSALQRGVKVEITLSSLCHFNKHGGVGSISYSDYYGDSGYFKKYLNPLRKNKASIRIFNEAVPDNSSSQKDGYLHSKVIIVDGEKVWIGSTNGSYGSTHLNREYGIIINDKMKAKEMTSILDTDFKLGMELEAHVPPPSASGSQGSLKAGSCKIKAQNSGNNSSTTSEEE